jgi:predicted methyltransferase
MIFRSITMAATLCLTLGVASCAQDNTAQNNTAHIEAAVANEARLEANVTRDGDRKPAAVLANYAVMPGMTVVDLFAGGGYFTEVLAGSVGSGGHVYAHQSAGRLENNRAAYEAQYELFGNISIAEMVDGRLPLEDNSVDFVFFGLVLHHFHYDEATPDARPERATALYNEVMRVLKPGGTFGVTEHVAIEGASREQSAAWHRIDLATAISDISGAGFDYVGNADQIHANADDDNANYWGDTGLRGQTNRMVLSFTKPE